MSGTGGSSGARIGDLLVAAQLISRVNVEAMAKEALAAGTRLGVALIKANFVTERDLYEQLAVQSGLPLGDLHAILRDADASLFRKVPARFLEHHHVLPFKREGDLLVVATSETRGDIAELGLAIGTHQLRTLLVTPTDLNRLRVALELGQVGPRSATIEHVVQEVLASETELESTLVALFDSILAEAITERTSDIHLERYGENVRVRFRIDGDLVDMSHYHLTPEQHLGIVNVVKVKANLDISERRIPQGGRFSTRALSKVFDLRVQTQPALHGEHLVIRILPQEKRVIELERLGFPLRLSKVYRRLLDSPGGLVLVVGPTGSGKTTTLNAGLQVLSQDTTRKVMTIEDPIEYAIDLVQQTQVRPEIGFNFADAMRVFVREDPDVILVGEIRDTETAIEAMRASQTGHLVLSTLHCNDSVDAVQRLVDLGVHPNSIASELLAVFAQRLARRICPHCRVPATPDPQLVAEVFPHGVPEGFVCFKGAGCGHCQGRGTYDRVAVVEYLPASAQLRLAIARRLPVDELRAEARKVGVQPMRTQALDFVTQGVIAFDELLNILSFEQLMG